jgi:hypothetical protein
MFNIWHLWTSSSAEQNDGDRISSRGKWFSSQYLITCIRINYNTLIYLKKSEGEFEPHSETVNEYIHITVTASVILHVYDDTHSDTLSIRSAVGNRKVTEYYRIWGLHSGGYEEHKLLGYNAV